MPVSFQDAEHKSHPKSRRQLGDLVVDGEVKGFLVETDSPGYHASLIEGKGCARAVWQADIRLNAVRVPAENRLPGANSFRDTSRALVTTPAR